MLGHARAFTALNPIGRDPRQFRRNQFPCVQQPAIIREYWRRWRKERLIRALVWWRVAVIARTARQDHGWFSKSLQLDAACGRACSQHRGCCGHCRSAGFDRNLQQVFRIPQAKDERLYHLFGVTAERILHGRKRKTIGEVMPNSHELSHRLLRWKMGGGSPCRNCSSGCGQGTWIGIQHRTTPVHFKVRAEGRVLRNTPQGRWNLLFLAGRRSANI